MITRMQQRRGTASEWDSVGETVILAPGEIGIEEDTGRFKVGDGTSNWNSLSYYLADEYNQIVYMQLSANQNIVGVQNFFPGTDEETPIVVKVLASQVADIQQWNLYGTNEITQLEEITVLARIDSEGQLFSKGATVSGDITLVSDDEENPSRIRGLSSSHLFADEAVSLAYVETKGSGLSVKQPVVAATTGPITLSGPQTIDGFSVVAGQRVLVKDQADQIDNGIYVANASTWVRSSDFSSDTAPGVKKGAYVLVENGTDNDNTSWFMTTDGTEEDLSIIFGTDDILFEKFFNPGAITAGNGLTQSGVTFSAVGVPGEISVGPSGISIDDAYTGQASITTVGNISSGTWNGSTINPNRGGTGAGTLTGYVYGNGTSAMTASTTIPGIAVTGNITGNSGNVSGTVQVANGGTGATTADGARDNLGVAQTVHTHTAAQITNPESLVVGRVYSGAVTSGTQIRIFLQSTQPTSPANGDLWFW